MQLTTITKTSARWAKLFAPCVGDQPPLSRSQALALAQKWDQAVVVPNAWDRFDVALPDGGTFSGDTLDAVASDLRERGFLCHLAIGLDGIEEQFSTARKTLNIQCVLCEGSGERSKWEVCLECDGRCEKLYQDGYDGGGWPHWVSQTCHSCGGAGGADVVHRCGFCSGDGYVECDESALLESDTVVGNMAVAG